MTGSKVNQQSWNKQGRYFFVALIESTISLGI